MRVDHIVVGHGLAGAALSRLLRGRGRRIVVLDRGDAWSASRVAAGLITPVTGKRFAHAPEYAQLRRVADLFYRDFEAELGARVLHADGALRIFRDAEERARFEARRERLGPLVEEAELPEMWRGAYGAFQMPGAARLDTRVYLDAHVRALGENYVTCALDPSEIELRGEDLCIPRLGLLARGLSFCRGFGDAENPCFPELRFEAAKGEVLELRVLREPPARTVHFDGLWLAKSAADRVRLGASYDWDALDGQVTPALRERLLARLEKASSLGGEVAEHAAAVRPILFGRQPVLGFSRRDPRVSVIAGLGSKGSLYAPFLAGLLADALEGAAIPAEYDVRARFGDCE